MKMHILLVLLATQLPIEQGKQETLQQQQEKTVCSTCHAGQIQTTLTPEGTTLCQECFKHERMKYLMAPS